MYSGSATVLKVGYNLFLEPHFLYGLPEGMKQNIAVFIIVIMMSKRLPEANGMKSQRPCCEWMREAFIHHTFPIKEKNLENESHIQVHFGLIVEMLIGARKIFKFVRNYMSAFHGGSQWFS